MSSLLGPSYDYWKSIKQPSEMGMSPGFSLGALATNVATKTPNGKKITKRLKIKKVRRKLLQIKPPN